MMSCIRCQRSTDDGFQRVNAGLCPTCAQTLAVIIQAKRKGHELEPHLPPLELALDR